MTKVPRRLPEPDPEPDPVYDRIYEAWVKFDIENPHIYDGLVRLARARVRATGTRHLGIANLYEALRHEQAIATRTEDGFKLNNNHRAIYAREIMEHEPDLDGIFDIRERGPER